MRIEEQRRGQEGRPRVQTSTAVVQRGARTAVGGPQPEEPVALLADRIVATVHIDHIVGAGRTAAEVAHTVQVAGADRIVEAVGVGCTTAARRIVEEVLVARMHSDTSMSSVPPVRSIIGRRASQLEITCHASRTT